MPDRDKRQRAERWPLDWRLSPSDIFEMVEIARRDPKAFGPEVRAALAGNPELKHAEAVAAGRAVGQGED